MKPVVKKIIDIAVVLLFLVGITLISSYLYLFDGVCLGDDSAFHLGNIYDTWYGMTHGLSIDSTNHRMMGIYAYNTHLFYAPLPHYFAALIMLMFNCSNIVAIKVSVSIFCFIGALFFYFFAKKVSNSTTVSLLGAAFFIFCPYRMFCGYCRFAYAETIAISLLPVLFYGIYSFTHDEKPTYRTFLAIILGISGLILSHPFTALSTAIICLVYMALRYKNTWMMIKNKKGLILSGVTIVMIFMLIGFYFFTMLIAKNSDLYRVSDDNAMWTTYDHVAGSTSSSANFSGFLNIDWIKGRIDSNRWPSDQPLYIYLVELGVLVGAWILLALGDFLSKKYIKNRYICLGISVISFWILPLTFTWLIKDVVFYFALIIVNAIYLISKFYADKQEEIPDENKEVVTIKKETMRDVAFILIWLAVNVILIAAGQVWHIVPSIFYSCQFAWRLWSMVTILASWLFVIFLNASVKSKHRLKYISPLLLGPSLLMVLTMSFREKGVALCYEDAKATIIRDYTDEDAIKNKNIGVMNEYMPQIFYDDKYESEYANSLFPDIKKTINHADQYIFTKEDYLSPAFLTGDGLLVCTELNTPDVVFDATVNEDSLIQLPQFYYDGYEITLVDKDTGTKTKADISNIDCLVSFSANKGEYTIYVNYKGPVIRRVFNIVFFVGLAGVITLSTLAGIELYREKKTKEDNNLQTIQW